jgi:N-lysine methyltransferase SETD6
MVTTKPIKAGEQIVGSLFALCHLPQTLTFHFLQWNTYGDPPNSDLLRKYGHIDMIPLPQGGEGNPSDIVEVRADLVVSTLAQQNCGISPALTKERIDWWLEEGGDE